MGVNTTEVEQRRYAENELASKLSFEVILQSNLKRYYSNVMRATRRAYVQQAIVPPMLRYSEELEEILRNHYGSVASQFGSDLRESIEIELGEDFNEEVDFIVDSNIINFINTRTAQSKYEITSTDQRQLDEVFQAAETEAGLIRNQQIADAIALGQAVPLMTLEDEVALRELIADEALDDFEDLIDSRLGTISATETEDAAESSKFIEMSTLLGLGVVIGGVALTESIASKRWDAILDNRVRPAHADADSQIVPANLPFIVGGQELMYPGDTSRGATPDNVINCRCSSVPVIDF